MKQHCYLVNVWLTWLGLPALAIAFGFYAGWLGGLWVLLVGILGQIAYLRWFPKISRWIGYGSVADKPAEISAAASKPVHVTLYTANVCPFCPIVRQRLNELQKELPIEVEEIDITFKPQIVMSKGFKSVPVIEAHGRFWVGNATTQQLADFITKTETRVKKSETPKVAVAA